MLGESEIFAPPKAAEGLRLQIVQLFHPAFHGRIEPLQFIVHIARMHMTTG
jgi:hypothetical protein